MIFNREIQHRSSGRMYMVVSFILVAVFIAEILAILFLHHDRGPAAAGDVAAFASTIGHKIGQMIKWVYRMVGPMIFPLVLLSVAEFVAILQLFRIWRKGCRVKAKSKLYQVLRIVECVAPGFGFLGTCLSLMVTMHHMDPGLSQVEMLKGLLENASSAFGSTVYGMSLAITSYLGHELFHNFLIQPCPDISEARRPISKPETKGMVLKEAPNAWNNRR